MIEYRFTELYTIMQACKLCRISPQIYCGDNRRHLMLPYRNTGFVNVHFYRYNRDDMKDAPTFIEEKSLWSRGYKLVAGIDEVGRGPLAGPVVAGAVILSSGNDSSWLSQVQDSKKLSQKKREFLADCIHREAIAVGIGMATHEEIDLHGIVGATRRAMCDAVAQLSRHPDSLLIDAVTLPELKIPQKSIIKGDSLSLSIAAASIVAKVYRDRLMMEYDVLYPGFGFARNMGYPTKEHMENLVRIGCCPIHRSSFAPVRRILNNHGR